MTHMQVALNVDVDLVFFDTHEQEQAQAHASRTDGAVYTWKTAGRCNWLERGFKLADRLGYFVLPGGLPRYIKLAADPGQP
jgi:hypothetical protein